MAFRIRRVEYFTCTVQDRPGEAYKLLSQLADLGLNLVEFTAVPMGPLRSAHPLPGGPGTDGERGA
jgi:prephenate dehydratase